MLDAWLSFPIIISATVTLFYYTLFLSPTVLSTPSYFLPAASFPVTLCPARGGTTHMQQSDQTTCSYYFYHAHLATQRLQKNHSTADRTVVAGTTGAGSCRSSQTSHELATKLQGRRPPEASSAMAAWEYFL